MKTPSVKATEATEQPPYAAAPRSIYIPDDDPKPRVNTSYKKVPPQFHPRRRRSKIKVSHIKR